MPREPLLVWKDSNGNSHALDADMVRSAKVNHAKRLTSYATERGAVVSDHVVFEPGEMTLELFQSQTPITSDGVQFARRTVNLQPVDGRAFVTVSKDLEVNGEPVTIQVREKEARPSEPIAIQVLAANGDVDRIADFYSQLLDLWESSTKITVHFRGVEYKDRILTKVMWNSAPGQVGVGRFQITLREFSTVTTRVVQLPPTRTRTDRGSQSPTGSGEEPEQENRQSLLSAAAQRAAEGLLETQEEGQAEAARILGRRNLR